MGTSSWGFSPSLRDIAAQERAQREADEQRLAREYVVQNKVEEKRRLQERLLAATYESNGATPREIELVNRMVQTKCPESFGNVAVHLMKLGELRSLIG